MRWDGLLAIALALGGCESASAPKAPSVDTAAVLLGNATCPVSGTPVAGTPQNPTFRSTFQGVTLGFMCPTHHAEFEQGTDAQTTAWLKVARDSLAGK